jgi:predicted NBD/HSP70 family sugar kinase
VSVLVQELFKLGLLVELGAQTDGRIGRPRSGLGVNGDRVAAVGLEIGVDYLAVCVTDLLRRVRFHRVEAIDNRGVTVDRVLDRAARLAGTALERAAVDSVSVAGIGVAVPGMVDIDAGCLLVAPNLDWADRAIVAELRGRLGNADLPILIDNEANLAGLAELWLGAGADLGDYVYVWGSIGIGAGLVVDGKLFRGSRGFAGEIGHIVVDPSGPECACGGHGCLERMAGQEAILAAAGLPRIASGLGSPDSSLPQLIELLNDGNVRALAAVRDAGALLGIALSDISNVIDPDTIVLGGNYADLTPWLAQPLEDALANQVIAAERRPILLHRSTLGPDAAVRGAAAWIIERVLARPGMAVSY